MKLDCVLTACNLNPLYIEFIPLFIQAWTRLYPEVDIVILFIADTIPDEYKQYEKHIRLFPPITGVNDIFISQVIRIVYPALLPYKNAVLITDIDMVPMNPTYFTRPLEPLSDTTFVHFRNGPELWYGTHQYAICYNAATPQIWSEITGIKIEADLRSWIQTKFTAIPEFSGVPDASGWYSDQTILYSLLNMWPRKNIHCLKDSATGYNRLDRGFQDSMHELIPKIESYTYSDYHCYRPHSVYKDLNETIITAAPPMPRGLETTNITNVGSIGPEMTSTNSFPLIKAGSGLTYQPVPTAYSSLINTKNKRVMLTTVRIPDDHIWANGLFQNVYVIYKMFESMGCEPWLLVDNNENHKDAKIHKEFRMLDFKEYSQKPFKIDAYIEMGMSCDPSIRRFFRSMGAKVAKLYLGNILNIDIETIIFFNGVNFSHHVAGELDEIWVSPHYDIHAEYAGSINGLVGKTQIAPYVWDPMFIQELGHIYDSTGITELTPRTFIIMEPNISYQKNSLMAIMAIEAYYRRYPELVQDVIVINGQKMNEVPYFQKSVLPNLKLYESGKLQLMPRAHIVNIAKAYKNTIIVQHQVNNEYNYSFLEWMTMGYPVVHNVSRLKSYGYYYAENDIEAAADAIENVVKYHSTHKEAYAAQSRQLIWTFSPYNPENIEAWKKLAFEK
jgi:hypothetical protein